MQWLFLYDYSYTTDLSYINVFSKYKVTKKCLTKEIRRDQLSDSNPIVSD